MTTAAQGARIDAAVTLREISGLVMGLRVNIAIDRESRNKLMAIAEMATEMFNKIIPNEPLPREKA